MSPEPGAQPYNPALTGLANQLGIDLSGLGSVGANTSDPPVFTGNVNRPRNFRLGGEDFPRAPVHVPQVMPLSQVQNQIYSWDTKQVKKFAGKLVSAGILDEEYTWDDLTKVWGALSAEAAKFYASGKMVTPMSLIGLYSRGGGISGPGRGPVTHTSTSKTFDLTDRDTAKAIADETYGKFLGRAAEGGESKQLQGELNKLEREHPSLTSTTTTTDEEGNSTTSSKSSGGLDAAARGQRAKELAMSDEEYSQYQAAAFYMPLLFQALGATV
jgi:hypothetical protein